MSSGAPAGEAQLHIWHALARLVHDLRNPLAAVASNIRYLRDGVEEEEREQVLCETEIASDALTRLLNDTADLGRLGLGERKNTPCAKNLAETESYLKDRIGNRIDAKSVHIKLPHIRLRLDHELLQRALGNALEHAVRHTPSQQSCELRGSYDGSALHISVIDGGLPFYHGHTPSILSCQLDRPQPPQGFRSDRGLAMVFAGQAIRAMGGQISVERRCQTQGAHFRISIPCTE